MILQVSWKRGHEEVNRLGCNSSGIFGRSWSPGLCFLLYHFICFFALLSQAWTLLVKPYLHPSCVLFVVCQCDSPSLRSFKHPVPPVHGLLDLGRGPCSVSHWHLLPLRPLSPPDTLILYDQTIPFILEVSTVHDSGSITQQMASLASLSSPSCLPQQSPGLGVGIPRD